LLFQRGRQKAIDDLNVRVTCYDGLVQVDRFDAKTKVIAEFGVTLCIDDQPEMLKNLSA